MKTWPPRHNSCCQRCALVKRLSEEKGSLFNSSSLTPCHWCTGREPGAGRAVRAALYLVSFATALKITRLCSRTSSPQGLIITKTTIIRLCRGLPGKPALSRTGIIPFSQLWDVSDRRAISKNEEAGPSERKWLVQGEGSTLPPTEPAPRSPDCRSRHTGPTTVPERITMKTEPGGWPLFHH